MLNYEIYSFNEAQVNNVAARGNDEQAQRMTEVLERDVINVSEGLTTPPVKMCYPYWGNIGRVRKLGLLVFRKYITSYNSGLLGI